MASSDFVDTQYASVAGAAAGNMTVTGIKVGDILRCVMPVSAASANLVGEFTITADNTINNTGGTSTATKIVLVVWQSRGGGRERIAAGAASRSRSSY